MPPLKSRPKAPKLSIPMSPIGGHEALGMREVYFIKTRTHGIVITPAQNAYGRVSFDYGCNLTHAPSGFRIGGTFTDLRVARLVAAALAGVMDYWDDRELTDHRAVVVAVRSLLERSPKLLAWLGSLNEWNVEPTSTQEGRQ